MVSVNKIYQKHKWRSLTSSLSRFFAIFGIVALGAGFLSGLLATTPDMRRSVDNYYDESGLMDIRVVSTLGLTGGDVQALREIEGVEAVEPGYTADVLANADRETEMPTRVLSLPDQINRLELEEGRLPERDGECVVDIPTGMNRDVKVGDTLAFLVEDTDAADTFHTTSYTVVGMVNSARYFSIDRENASVGNGTIALFAYIPVDSFALDVYTDAYLTVMGAAEQTAFTQEYDDSVTLVTDRLDTLADTRAVIRTEEVVGEATDKLNDAKADYEKGKQEAEKELAEAKSKIDNAKQEIADGEAELVRGWQQLADSEAALAEQRTNAETELAAKQDELEQARAEWVDGQTKLSQAEQQLAAAAAALQKGQTQLEQLEAAGMTEQAAALKTELDQQQAAYEQGMQQWTEQKAALDATEQQIEEGFQQLAAASAQTQAALEEGQKQLDASRAELENAEKELASAKAEIEQAETEYETGKQEAEEELADGKAKIEQAEADIAAIDPAEWYVLDRSSITSYSGFDGNAEKVNAIAKVFPVFFCLVAALVALTTMTRMVEEERLQIGTLKALGYSNAAIMGKYLLYAGMATSLGCLAGMAIGFQVFPRVIWNAYGIMYDLPPLHVSFYGGMAAVIFAILFISILIATASACHSILKQNAAALLQPRAPKAGKRILLEHITPLWKRMPFIQKVTARNIFRYKKRFFMTILGVAGCTALLVAGFGLSDSITGIVSRQFGQIYQYDLTLGLTDSDAITQNEELVSLLEDKTNITEYLLLAQPSVDASAEGTTKTAHLYVPQQADRLTEYVTLRERQGHEPLALTDDGVIVTEKLAKQLGLSVGDSFHIKDTDNRSATVTVSGITEHYVQNYVYMTSTAYQKAFGTAPEYTVLAAKPAEGLDQDDLSKQLLATGDVALVQFTDTMRDNLNDTLSSIDYIVLVLIICAGLLAFVVLYNLTNINITERQKELATIKVLGFYDREVSSYIYRETTILMLIGTVVGLLAGVALHAFVVQTAEVDMVMFVREISWPSYLYAALLTMAFSILVDVAMLPRLRRIDMVESMKAGE